MGILTDIAAATQCTETAVPLPFPNGAVVCLSDPRRYSLGFSVVGSGSAVISTSHQGVGSQGFTVTAGPIVWITVKDQGNFAQQEWVAIPIGGLSLVTVWEVLIPGD